MNTGVLFGVDASNSRLNTATLVAPGEDVAALAFSSSLNQAFAESTILRIRGSMSLDKSVAGSAGLTEAVAFGIGIISEQASEVLTAIPNPATATGYDWDGWLFLRQNFSTSLEPNAEVVDVKAMRKWRSGDSIVFVVGSSTDNVAGMASAFVQFSLRGLFLLP